MENSELSKAITIANTPENIKFLISIGYERRSGSGGYKREFICVLPFKLWFWETSSVYTKIEDMSNYVS